MNPLVKTLLGITLVLGGVVALLLIGEAISGIPMGVRMMSTGARFDEFGGYAVLILLIAALGSVVAWMLFDKTE